MIREHDYDTYQGMRMVGKAVQEGQETRDVVAIIDEYDWDSDGVCVMVNGSNDYPLVTPTDRHLSIGAPGQRWVGVDEISKTRYELTFVGV